ncbi:hypothetical protein [Dyella telluris]|uniref:Uncharacterized protein n=1 Tax=Dyella telluris TaxID=2763498 RepID=A0A7G8Q5C2_9GAMM|nr:hypothetical protein [Dyella telluris]QNK01980.1 hypothetical protein H8F01_02080 [Dyella telluris]
MQGPAPFPAPPPIPAPSTPAAPKPRRAFPLWLGVALGVVLGVVLMVGGFAWWGWNLFEDQATAAMNAHPVIQRCIGTIEHTSLDLSATGDDPRDDAFGFRVRGTRGSGLVIAVFTTADADNEAMEDGELRLDNGKTIRLVSDEDDDDDHDPGQDCA